MITLASLKRALRQKAAETVSSPTQPLSDTQYRAGFDILVRSSGWAIYEDFVIPQLVQLLTPLFNSRIRISVLEIGPGPQSILKYLPVHLKRKVSEYTAYEPNASFAASLYKWISSTSDTGSRLPCLDSQPKIHQVPFRPDSHTRSNTSTSTSDRDEKFDVIIFSRGMDYMDPKHKFVERALEMLVSEGGMVVVFHSEEYLHLDGLACHRTASFPTGVIRVVDNGEVLDNFASFVAGFTLPAVDEDRNIRFKWRGVCRDLGRHEEAYPGHLLFSSPTVMVAFNQYATSLPKLTAQVPLVKGGVTMKSREGRLHHPAATVRPTEIQHVQQCVEWALKHGLGLTVIGGGHSGHGIWPNVVSVDMSAFDQIHIVTAEEEHGKSRPNCAFWAVVGAGCKTGDIVCKTMEAGLTVPMGTRPSVGAGLWLQGGIGHLTRRHGLTCDAIIGAVIVSVNSGQVLCVGCVPSQHQPPGAVCPDNEAELLWAIKGAGTNFGIVIGLIFKTYEVQDYLVHTWTLPLHDNDEARDKLYRYDEIITRCLVQSYSTDIYLHGDKNQFFLDVTILEPSTTSPMIEESIIPSLSSLDAILGLRHSDAVRHGLGLVDDEKYRPTMPGDHSGGNTSSFKRCLFLYSFEDRDIVDSLLTAFTTRPSPLCYLHLVRADGTIGDVMADATAFGCRDWCYACVVTGVWPRNQDGTEVCRAAIQWVYKVTGDLLPFSSGAYGADLGPDPRDAALAAKAFGPNWLRLARLKHTMDPCNVLAYTCPLPKAPLGPKLILLVTGESCAGKDHCAGIWVFAFISCTNKALSARSVSISDETKREYAAAISADINRLLRDRTYKEQHRPALTAFFQDQVRRRPRLPEEHFLSAVYGALDVDVLLITGMRDEAPVANFSHLVPDSRVLEVRVEASYVTRWLRRGSYGHGHANSPSRNEEPSMKALDCLPSLVFNNENNDITGNRAAVAFAERRLLPLLHEDLQRLANMVRLVPSFPRPGIDFQHVLDISQQRGGLALCTSLLQTHFTGDWTQVDVVACCEAGGFIYASALAAQVDIPLALIRQAGKLPPPTVSAANSPSHISSSSSATADNGSKESRIEMDRDVIPKGASVVVVDDVLATGVTLCAVLQLLTEVGVGAAQVSVLAVAEFPVHRGRELLRRRGFGGVNVQSLLVFGGA